MDKQKLWNVLKIVLKIAFTTLLLYLVFRKIDVKDIKNHFYRSNLFYVFLAFITYYVSQVVSSWRSLSLLKAIGLDLEFGFNFRLYLVGMFYNITLPGGVGGDGYKIYILRKKYKLPTKRILLAMLFDRMSGLWAIGVIAVLLIIFIPQINIPTLWPIFALLSGTLIYYWVMRTYFPDYAKKFFQVHAKATCVQALQVGTVICILLSQNFNAKFSPYLFGFLVSTLAANVPVSFAGVGAREYAMTHVSTIFGMDQALAIFLCVAFFLISTLAALSGLWCVYRSQEFEPAPTQQQAKDFEAEADSAAIAS